MITVMAANRRNGFQDFMNPKASGAEKTSVSLVHESKEAQSEVQKARDSYWKAHDEPINKLDLRPVTGFDYSSRMI